MLPKSAFGFWMSKERYKSFDELVGVVDEYRKRRIPLDNIVQDWQYWGEDMGLWNSMNFDTVRFARPKEIIDRLHQEYHVKLSRDRMARCRIKKQRSIGRWMLPGHCSMFLPGRDIRWLIFTILKPKRFFGNI